MSELEITALVLSEHEAFRRAFADLEHADDIDAAWRSLTDRLEVHAVAEEQLLYPELAAAAADGPAEAQTAVREHNDIRHAVRDVAACEAGTDDWWDAVRRTQEVNAEHMAEEEREFVPDFRDSVEDQRREDLGLRWLQFHDDHDRAQGLDGRDADPATVAATSKPWRTGAGADGPGNSSSDGDRHLIRTPCPDGPRRLSRQPYGRHTSPPTQVDPGHPTQRP